MQIRELSSLRLEHVACVHELIENENIIQEKGNKILL